MRTSKLALTILAAVAFSALLFTSSCETKNAEQATDMADTTADINMDMDQDKTENSITKFRKALANLPRQEVVSIFNGMTPEFRATLWRNRISDALEMNLTEEQKNVLMQAVENISAESYTKEGQGKFEAFYKDFRPMAINAFADDTVKLLNIVTKLDEPAEMSKEVKEAEKEDCNCNVSDDWCAINFDCKPRTCETSSWGCGWFWTKSCDGLCIYAP